MRFIEVNDLKSKEKVFWICFNKLLEGASFHLDQYTHDEIFALDDIPINDIMKNEIERFFQYIPEIAARYENGYFREKISKLDAYEQNQDFLKWLEDYEKNVKKAHEQVKGSLGDSNDSLKTDFTAVFQCVYLEHEDFWEISEKISEKNVMILRYKVISIILRDYLQMRVGRLSSKNESYGFVFGRYGINQQTGDWIEELYENHKTELWNYFLMQKCSDIERKIMFWEESLKEEEKDI